MAYISKITRNYSFKGKIVRLEIGKEVPEDLASVFSEAAKLAYFTEISDDKEKTETKKVSKKSKLE